MTENSVYRSLIDVLSDDVFPSVDCQLRAGKHIGQEEFGHYSFLNNAQPFLAKFYRRYNCQLVRANEEVGDYFYLHSFGSLLGNRKLSVPAMKVGMALGYMVCDPEYMDRQIQLPRLIATLKLLLGEDRFYADFNPAKAKWRNTDLDDDKIIGELRRAVRQLHDLGFVNFSRRGGEIISVLSPIYRFLDPIRGIGDLEESLKKMIADNVVENDDFDDAPEDDAEVAGGGE